MAAKIVYNDELLDRILQRDNANLCSRHDKYTNKSQIEFTCNCGNKYVKYFKQLNITGAFCKTCTMNNMKNILHKFNLSKTNYNKELLENICKRDHFIVDWDLIKECCYKHLIIKFICSCGNAYEKTFGHIVKHGGFCKECTLKIADKKSKDTCLKKYGHEYSLQSKEVREKGKQTLLKTLGVDHQLKSEEVQNKKKETCLTKMGVEHQFLLPKVQAKCKKTIEERYHVESCMQCPEIKEKHKQTCLKNWGVENATQSLIVQNKYRETCLQRYNVVSTMQLPEISQKQLKSGYRTKAYKFPDGQIIQVQGYEPYLLDILVSEGYTSSDIITDRTHVPEIWYIKTDNKKARYFCDAYVRKTNTIYEVKSTWTYKKDTDNILRKQQACIDAGYIFKLYIFNAKGEIQN
jgi:hypothetical protein